MGWRLYTVTDWCVEKMGPWTGRGAILFPDLDRHGHDLPAFGPLATGKAKPRHQVGQIPWCARRTVPVNMRKRMFVRRVRRAHHGRSPARPANVDLVFLGGIREERGKTFIALKQWKTSPQWRRGEKSFAPAGEELCRTGRPVGTDRQRACIAQSAAICSGPRWMPMTLPWMSTSPRV